MKHKILSSIWAIITPVLPDNFESIFNFFIFSSAEIHACLKNISPELLGDAADHGITLCGGGALLFDIAERFEEELDIRCNVTEEPEKARTRGLHKIMKSTKIMENNDYQFIFKDDIRDKLKRFDKI